MWIRFRFNCTTVFARWNGRRAATRTSSIAGGRRSFHLFFVLPMKLILDGNLEHVARARGEKFNFYVNDFKFKTALVINSLNYRFYSTQYMNHDYTLFHLTSAHCILICHIKKHKKLNLKPLSSSLICVNLKTGTNIHFRGLLSCQRRKFLHKQT